MSAHESAVEECCICMEALIYTSNYVKTECGHQFHCSCLMKNTAHNGYGCPYCRAALAEEVLDESDDEEEDYETDDDEYVDEEDNTLLGLRLFTNRIEEEANEDDNTMELNRVINHNTYMYYTNMNKTNYNLRVDYLKKKERYMLEHLQKHNIGINELISWLQYNHDTALDEETEDTAFGRYMESSDFSEYNLNNFGKINGLITSIAKRFVSLNPLPVLLELQNTV